MNANWRISETDANISLMAEVLGIGEITARILALRGLRTKKTAQTFLHPAKAPLHDTLSMKNAEAALARIAKALTLGEKIIIYGDYDVDGVMSTVILYRVIRRLGGNASYYIPHRMEEGYGLNPAAIQHLADDAQLLIAVDNGISAIAEVDLANRLGLEVIIIDHHEPGEALPDAVAVVDPKQPGCPYPFKELCAAGLAYKLAGALCAAVGTPYIEEAEMCALAAVASICDIVALQDENRTLVHRGLAVLNQSKLINPGLGSLITQRGYLEKPIDTHCIGFILGPCLNATGRLENAGLSVKLLLAEDAGERIPLAQALIALNGARKDLTAECVERALTELEKAASLPRVVVLTDPAAHESVAGIVAGRIRDITGRPVIILTKGENAMKGSGRSIAAYNLFEALYAHRGLFTRFGGHAMAAGLTLPEENIPLLREYLNRDCTLTEEELTPALDIDCVLDAEEITLELSRELEALAPFGKSNPAPLFATYRLYAESVRVINEKNTLIFTFKTKAGRRVKGIAFGLNQQYAKAAAEAGLVPTGGFFMDAAYHIETNVYNGIVSVQMGIRDFVIS
jgi:single-stranded-DNA-specific exonuclease